MKFGDIDSLVFEYRGISAEISAEFREEKLRHAVIYRLQQREVEIMRVLRGLRVDPLTWGDGVAAGDAVENRAPSEGDLTMSSRNQRRAMKIGAADVALIAGPDDALQIFVPNDDRTLSRNQLLLTAVALRIKDEAWVERTLAILNEDEAGRAGTVN